MAVRSYVATRPTYDARIVPEQEARSTDEEAEEVGSKGTKPRARKLRHDDGDRAVVETARPCDLSQISIGQS